MREISVKCGRAGDAKMRKSPTKCGRVGISAEVFVDGDFENYGLLIYIWTGDIFQFRISKKTNNFLN